MISVLLLACFSLPSHASAPQAPRRIEVLLNAPMAKTAELGPLNAGLAVTPDRLVLVGSQKEMFLVGWGGVRPISGLSGLDAFAYAHDGTLLGIRKRELVYLNAEGDLKTLFMLPSEGMGISSGAGKRMFLFERKARKNGLYELSAGRKIVKLLESPEPIGAVTEAADGRVLFAAGGSLFEISQGKKVLTAAVGGKPIFSLAAKGRRVYASDGASVISIDGEKLSMITKETGGDLRWFDDGLLVFDSKAPLLIRITGL